MLGQILVVDDAAFRMNGRVSSQNCMLKDWGDAPQDFVDDAPHSRRTVMVWAVMFSSFLLGLLFIEGNINGMGHVLITLLFWNNSVINCCSRTTVLLIKNSKGTIINSRMAHFQEYLSYYIAGSRVEFKSLIDITLKAILQQQDEMMKKAFNNYPHLLFLDAKYGTHWTTEKCLNYLSF